MKPEEMDRLFRDELEKLDHVPGMEWTDQAAWNKISKKIKGGWNNLYTWALSIVSLAVIIYMIYNVIANTDHPATQVKKRIPLIEDTIKNNLHKEIPVSVKKLKTEKRSAPATRELYPVVYDDSLLTASVDSLLLPVVSDTLEYSLKRQQLFNRYKLQSPDWSKPEFTLSMPTLSFLKLKIDNGFNFSNLAKSIRAQKYGGDNFYYFYEQNKNFVPPLYENSHPKFNINNTYTITNFNK